MNTVTIIQARMGSTRLPGKVLLDLGGETVLSRVVHRVRRARLSGEIVIATTTNPADDVIVRECRKLHARCFRGSQDDVLDRFYGAAGVTNADIVVRITSDCPLIDPVITDQVIEAFLQKRPDYASNTLRRTYPRGLDTEVMSFDALAAAWQSARAGYQRTHVTPYLYEHPELFKLLEVCGREDHSACRWTLDTPEDLAFITAVYERLGNTDTFAWTEVLDLLHREPELAELNSGVRQKALQEG